MAYMGMMMKKTAEMRESSRKWKMDRERTELLVKVGAQPIHYLQPPVQSGGSLTHILPAKHGMATAQEY